MKGIKICEEEMEGYVEYNDPAQFEAFSSGFYSGADKYGGNGMVLTRDDLLELHESLAKNPTNKYIKNRIDLIEKYLPE